jgi:hypothetical protein
MMNTGVGKVLELLLQDGLRHARIACPANLIPSAGQYLLASSGSDPLLPASVFYTDSALEGFITAPAPDTWIPRLELFLRGPLGRGFALPSGAKKICLVAFDDPPIRLRGLIRLSMKQQAAVTLVTDAGVDSFPDEIEVQPLASLTEILAWADYVAMDVARENLQRLMEKLGKANLLSVMDEAEVLVRAQTPCGGIAECGVCAVTTRSGWSMTCKDGPVFSFNDL